MFIGHALLAFALVVGAAERFSVPRERVLQYGIVAGLFAAVPDVDVVYAPVGLLLRSAETLGPDVFWETANVIHRGPTHSLVMGGALALSERAGVATADVRDRVASITDRLLAEQRAYLRDHPELLQSPAQVIRMDEEGRAQIVDRGLADRIGQDVEAARMGAHSSTPISVAVTRDLQARYRDMPQQLAEGLGDTYARVQEARRSEPTFRVIETPELDRVLAHERAGELSAPFETEAERDAFRGEIARVLDVRQLDRLTSGDADALDKVLEDRLDRLYVAKVYLQSDAATANTEALRQVVDDLADTEYEKHRATDVDGETERGQVH